MLGGFKSITDRGNHLPQPPHVPALLLGLILSRVTLSCVCYRNEPVSAKECLGVSIAQLAYVLDCAALGAWRDPTIIFVALQPFRFVDSGWNSKSISDLAAKMRSLNSKLSPRIAVTLPLYHTFTIAHFYLIKSLYVRP